MRVVGSCKAILPVFQEGSTETDAEGPGVYRLDEVLAGIKRPGHVG